MKILVKIGSALISQNNRINYPFLEKKVAEISALQKEGNRLILVTSGAVAAGMEIRGITKRPTDLLSLQMLSGMGQVKLIQCYREYFKKNEQFIAQVLVTHHNFDKEREVSTLMRVLDAYLQEGIIPIVNENDLVDKTELESSPVFSDNDILSAIVASKLHVDLVVILTDVDGLFSDNPKKNSEARFFDVINRITEETFLMADHGKSDLGLGGMRSKVEATKIITVCKIPVIIGNGNSALPDLLSGKVRRSYFPV